jgi:IBR domain, a half RING-finger domain
MRLGKLFCDSCLEIRSGATDARRVPVGVRQLGSFSQAVMRHQSKQSKDRPTSMKISILTMAAEAEPILHFDPRRWTVTDVEDWARSVKLSEATIAALRENEVNGVTLVTLSRAEIQHELGIKSLAARRYLHDLIERLKIQQVSANFYAALDVHAEEIENLNTVAGVSSPDDASGGFRVDDAVITTLMRDTETQYQVLEDHLLALRAQASLDLGEEYVESHAVARREQQRLDELALISEVDHRLAQQLSASNNARPRPEAVRSLFALAVDACARNQINVADALPAAQARLFGSREGQAPSVTVSDDEEEEVDDAATVTVDNIAHAHSVLGPFVSRRGGGTVVPVAASARATAKTILSSLPRVRRCNVCYEENVRGVAFACDHKSCVDCLRNLFRAVLRDTSLLPIRCCEIPIDTFIAAALLRKEEFETLDRRIMEYEAERKMYCPSCGTFVNLDGIGNITDLACDCGVALCAVCTTLAHPTSTCLENQSQQTGNDSAVLELAKTEGWKQCPRCANMIELSVGCNHMTCRCGHDFCYVCLSAWGSNGRCSSGRCAVWDENRLLEAAGQRVQQNVGNRVVAPQERARLVQREVNALANNESCRHQWSRQGHYGECERCGFELHVYGMRCQSGCGAMVCYTCAHHRIPQRGWR